METLGSQFSYFGEQINILRL